MHILDQLGLALGLATLAGVNLYLTVLLTGLAVRFDVLHLASQYQQFEVLGHPVVLIVAGVLFCIEFCADKVPWLDSLWDAVHTVIRPVGGVLLGLRALGEMPPYLEVAAALIAGGAALTTHAAKSGTRLLVNHSPEPVSNVALSVTEDVAVTGGTALTLLNPVVALIVFTTILVILWMVFPRIWRGIRATAWLMWNKLKMPGKREPLTKPVELDRDLSAGLRDLLKIQEDVKEPEVVAAVRCLSGKSRGLRGLQPNLRGVLVLTTRADKVYFTASKGLSERFFALPLAEAKVLVESKFLSENLLVETPDCRAVFRFPRGHSAVVETLSLRLNESLAATKPVEPLADVEAPVPAAVTELEQPSFSKAEPVHSQGQNDSEGTPHILSAPVAS